MKIFMDFAYIMSWQEGKPLLSDFKVSQFVFSFLFLLIYFYSLNSVRLWLFNWIKKL